MDNFQNQHVLGPSLDLVRALAAPWCLHTKKGSLRARQTWRDCCFLLRPFGFGLYRWESDACQYRKTFQEFQSSIGDGLVVDCGKCQTTAENFRWTRPNVGQCQAWRLCVSSCAKPFQGRPCMPVMDGCVTTIRVWQLLIKMYQASWQKANKWGTCSLCCDPPLIETWQNALESSRV